MGDNRRLACEVKSYNWVEQEATGQTESLGPQCETTSTFCVCISASQQRRVPEGKKNQSGISTTHSLTHLAKGTFLSAWKHIHIWQLIELLGCFRLKINDFVLC